MVSDNNLLMLYFIVWFRFLFLFLCVWRAVRMAIIRIQSPRNPACSDTDAGKRMSRKREKERKKWSRRRIENIVCGLCTKCTLFCCCLNCHTQMFAKCDYDERKRKAQRGTGREGERAETTKRSGKSCTWKCYAMECDQSHWMNVMNGMIVIFGRLFVPGSYF